MINKIKATLLFILFFSFANADVDVDWQTMLDEPVVISLSRHMNRYEQTVRLMENAGFTNIQRFEAIDGSATSDDFFKSLEITSGNRGQKGCSASHILLWKQFLEDESDKEYLFVCEDDMLPHTDFYTLFPIYWEMTPKDFDLVMVGNWLNSLRNNEQMILTIPTMTTHAYIISKKGAQILLDLFSQKKRSSIIDSFLFQMMKQKEIIYYCYNGKKYPDPQNTSKGLVRFGTGICFQNKKMPSTIANSRR